jgi:hypothetical protein
MITRLRLIVFTVITVVGMPSPSWAVDHKMQLSKRVDEQEGTFAKRRITSRERSREQGSGAPFPAPRQGCPRGAPTCLN